MSGMPSFWGIAQGLLGTAIIALFGARPLSDWYLKQPTNLGVALAATILAALAIFYTWKKILKPNRHLNED